MKNLVAKSGHQLKICYEYMNRGDRWMQVKRMRDCFQIKLYLHSSLNVTGTLNLFLIRTKEDKNVLQIFYLCQDELEFGYIDSPHQRFPVVLDSPRDGKLQDFPYKELLVRDTISSFICAMIQQRLNFLFRKARTENGQNLCMGCVVHHMHRLAASVSSLAPSLVSAAPTRMMIRSFVSSPHIINHISQAKQLRRVLFFAEHAAFLV